MRWVRGASATQLQSAMHGPLHTILLWQIFTTMCQRCNAAQDPGLEAIIEFRIRRPGGRRVDRYWVAVADGRCASIRPGERTATVVLDMDAVSFLRLVGGATAPAVLLLRGKLKIRGNVLLAARLPNLLNIPAPPG